MSKVVDFITARRASLPRFGLLRDLGLFCPSAKNDELTQKLADTLARVQKLGGESGVLFVTDGYRIPSKTWPGAWSLPREAYADVICSGILYLELLHELRGEGVHEQA